MSYVASVIKHAHEQILLFHVHIQYINLWLQALAHTFNEWELYRRLQVRDKTYGEAKNGTCMCRTKQPAHKHPQLAREFGLVEHCRVCAHSQIMLLLKQPDFWQYGGRNQERHGPLMICHFRRVWYCRHLSVGIALQWAWFCAPVTTCGDRWTHYLEHVGPLATVYVGLCCETDARVEQNLKRRL